MNSELEKAARVADYLEVGELMCYDALTREESCGAHFREEHQTSDGEAVRDDQNFSLPKFVSDEELQKVVRPEAMTKRDSIEDEKWR